MAVRAKRLGWNEQLTDEQTWDLDPYEADPNVNDDLEGELEEYDVPATEEHGPIHMCLVGGQEADPATVEELTENAYCPTGVGGGQDNSCGKQNLEARSKELAEKLSKEWRPKERKDLQRELDKIHRKLGFFGEQRGISSKQVFAPEMYAPSKLPPLGKQIQAPQEHVDAVVDLAKRVGGEDNLASLGDLRRASDLSKKEFDAALLRAYQDRRISLKPHEGFSELSKEDRAASFELRDGNDYTLFAYASARG